MDPLERDHKEGLGSSEAKPRSKSLGEVTVKITPADLAKALHNLSLAMYQTVEIQKQQLAKLEEIRSEIQQLGGH